MKLTKPFLEPLLESLDYPDIIRLCQTEKSVTKLCTTSTTLSNMIQTKRESFLERLQTMPLDKLQEYCNSKSRPCALTVARKIVQKRLPIIMTMWVTAKVDFSVNNEDCESINDYDMRVFTAVVTNFLNMYLHSLEFELIKAARIDNCDKDDDQLSCSYSIALQVPSRIQNEWDGDDIQELKYMVEKHFDLESDGTIGTWYHNLDNSCFEPTVTIKLVETEI